MVKPDGTPLPRPPPTIPQPSAPTELATYVEDLPRYGQGPPYFGQGPLMFSPGLEIHAHTPQPNYGQNELHNLPYYPPAYAPPPV